MAEIVNLNQYRKGRKRSKAAADASANRARHGQTKSEKQHKSAERDMEANSLEGKRLDRRDHPPDTD